MYVEQSCRQQAWIKLQQRCCSLLSSCRQQVQRVAAATHPSAEPLRTCGQSSDGAAAAQSLGGALREWPAPTAPAEGQRTLMMGRQPSMAGAAALLHMQ